jgi:hypothetical protein
MVRFPAAFNTLWQGSSALLLVFHGSDVPQREQAPLHPLVFLGTDILDAQPVGILNRKFRCTQILHIIEQQPHAEIEPSEVLFV